METPANKMDLAVSLAIALLQNAALISQIVAKAQAENRELNDDDWNMILNHREVIRTRALAELARAQSEGR